MTMPPAQAMRKAKESLLPHWAGETHTEPVKIIIATIPKLVGLKMCLRSSLNKNLLVMVITAVRNAKRRVLVRSKRQRENPEMSALRGSKELRPNIRVHAHWTNKTVESKTTSCGQPMSNSSQPTP